MEIGHCMMVPTKPIHLIHNTSSIKYEPNDDDGYKLLCLLLLLSEIIAV